MPKKKKKAFIKRRRKYIAAISLILILVIALSVLAVKLLSNKKGQTDTASDDNYASSDAPSAEEPKGPAFNNEPEMVTLGVGENAVELDANYKQLLLVNGKNPLPDDYPYGSNMATVPANYHNGQLDQLDSNVWPYMKAMIDTARSEGVNLSVWSPYRSYDIQKMLFDKQVNRNIANGMSAADADTAAATVVARPGTSEHHTGFASDINSASDSFESTPMFAWLNEHAAEYGFILRYPKDKQDITGVIYESWHYRFVGINVAKEIKSMGVTLEEYLKANGFEYNY